MGQITERNLEEGFRALQPGPKLLYRCAATAAFVGLAAIAGCLQLSGQPCPSGAEQCPTGFACRQGTCETVGNDGAVAVIHAGLSDNFPADESDRIFQTTMTSYLDSSMTCLLGRDPADDSWLQNVRATVTAPVVLGEATEVRVPTGRQVILVRAQTRTGEDVARACFVWDQPDPGEWQDFWVRLWRNGVCGDGTLDVGEQCDHRGESERCTEDCESLPVDIRNAASSGGACLTEPTIACTWNDTEEDGRCLVGWIEGGASVHVEVQELLGQNDPEEGRGFVREDVWPRHLRLASHGTEAAAVWIESSGQMYGRALNWLGQNNNSFEVEGDASGALLSVASYVDRNDQAVLVAGWVSDGSATIEEVEINDRWHVDLPRSPSAGAAAALFSSSLVVTWSEDQFAEDENGAVIVTRVGYGNDEPWWTEPVVVPDYPRQAQRQPAVTPVEHGRAFFVWTDENGELGDDTSGSGIRGRRLGDDVADESVPINHTSEGNQHTPVVAFGRDYVVALWHDDDLNQIRARYLSSSGQPMSQSFGQGGRGDFPIATGVEHTGRPAIATLDSVYFLWVEQPGSCEHGGTVLRMRIMPPPLP